jgi:ribosomal protein L16 Arg81 hydroxylase
MGQYSADEATIVWSMLEGAPLDVMLSAEQAARAELPVAAWINAKAPALARAERQRERTRRHANWMSAVRRRLAAGEAAELAVEEAVDAQRFHEEYYRRNRPVLLRALHARGGTRWRHSLHDLRAAYGEVAVEIMRNRSRDADDPSFMGEVERAPLGRFIDAIHEGRAAGSYLTPVCDALGGPLREAFAAFDPLPGIVRADWTSDGAALWMGPHGTVTGLHFDSANVVLVPLIGRKRVILVAPHDSAFLYKHARVPVSRADLASPSAERFPLLACARRLETVIEPGVALFVPVGWWHYVESLDDSLSATMKSFGAPNAFAVPPE